MAATLRQLVAFCDDPARVDALLVLLRGLTMPAEHTGRVTIHLDACKGVVLRGSYNVENIPLGGGMR